MVLVFGKKHRTLDAKVKGVIVPGATDPAEPGFIQIGADSIQLGLQRPVGKVIDELCSEIHQLYAAAVGKVDTGRTLVRNDPVVLENASEKGLVAKHNPSFGDCGVELVGEEDNLVTHAGRQTAKELQREPVLRLE